MISPQREILAVGAQENRGNGAFTELKTVEYEPAIVMVIPAHPVRRLPGFQTGA